MSDLPPAEPERPRRRRRRWKDANGLSRPTKDMNPRLVKPPPDVGPIITVLTFDVRPLVYRAMSPESLGRLASTCRAFHLDMTRRGQGVIWIPKQWREHLANSHNRSAVCRVFHEILRPAGFFAIPMMATFVDLYVSSAGDVTTVTVKTLVGTVRPGELVWRLTRAPDWTITTGPMTDDVVMYVNQVYLHGDAERKRIQARNAVPRNIVNAVGQARTDLKTARADYVAYLRAMLKNNRRRVQDPDVIWRETQELRERAQRLNTTTAALARAQDEHRLHRAIQRRKRKET